MSAHRRPQPHHGARLSPALRRLTYTAAGVAWLSGALWLLFHYFLQRRGEFALEPHPLEHWWLRLHGLCAFVLLWLGGVLWTTHVRHGLGWPQRRRSGIAIMLAFCVLAASGYLIYYADEGALHEATAVLHWIAGLAIAVPLLLHCAGAAAARRSRT